jgi:hypothetical protein
MMTINVIASRREILVLRHAGKSVLSCVGYAILLEVLTVLMY